MMSMTITSNAPAVYEFMVHVAGSLQDRHALNEALALRLTEELKEHFQRRNSEPNKMGADKTNFWSDMAAATQVATITDSGATVAVGDMRLRVHVFGGVIRPTGGRKFLTIPLIAAARGLRVSAYEQETGHKLFRLPGTRVLAERSGEGDPSNMAGGKVTIRGKGGTYRKLTIRGRSQIRVVYALATQATIHKDPRALPPIETLIAALTESGNAWLSTLPSQ